MNESTFFATLHESPDDELTWSALADWLDEDGQAERAELVRLVRSLRTMPVMRRSRKRPSIESRIAALLTAGVRPVAPEIVNSIGMRLALIPPGRFRMGIGDNISDGPVHEVTISRPFYLGVFTVTQAQYEQVMGTNPSHFCSNGAGKALVGDMDTSDFPVEMVSSHDAESFCQALPDLDADRTLAYRFPTEAEWEYACRAWTTTDCHFGDSMSSHQANCDGTSPHGGAPKGPFLRRTCAVGSYRPNAFGLYDMHGNVWEWCQDWYRNYDSKPVTDPRGPSSGMYRNFRGGRWDGKAEHCRSGTRSNDSSHKRDSRLGFRVAADRL